MSWYLRSGGRANSVSGDGGLTADPPTGHEPPDTFESDPQNPVPTRGGAMIGDGAGMVRQDDVELRRDVLVYTTAPLAEDVEVTGPLTATLYVATSASHTDFTAKLVDVQRDGTPYNVSDGILRRQYPAVHRPGDRRSGAHRGLTLADQHGVPAGTSHQARGGVEQFSAVRPQPQYGRDRSRRRRVTAVARQAVHHGPRALSRIVLPVVPSTR